MIELLRKRRSIRNFIDKPIDENILEILKEAALRAPTSKNRKPWEFIFITEKDLCLKLSRAKPHGSAFLKNAPLIIVVCADPEKSDVWIEDCSIASILLQMTALDMNVDSCWVQIRNRKHDDEVWASQYVKSVLNIPAKYEVECMIGFGYRAESKEPIKYSDLPFDKIHSNKF
ncbi:MAG: nitroreductase family protein [Deferribacterota bacterium]|nr:nitroreductase family protein [Deferribacterota bacterium]